MKTIVIFNNKVVGYTDEEIDDGDSIINIKNGSYYLKNSSIYRASRDFNILILDTNENLDSLDVHTRIELASAPVSMMSKRCIFIHDKIILDQQFLTEEYIKKHKYYIYVDGTKYVIDYYNSTKTVTLVFLQKKLTEDSIKASDNSKTIFPYKL